MLRWELRFEGDGAKIAELSGPTLRRALANHAAANPGFAKDYNSAAMTVEGRRVTGVQLAEQ